MANTLLHATCIELEGKGVLLAGEPGTGKSDLALRLIERGAQLVADDQTELRIENGQLMASSPAAIAGMLEVRNIGLLRLPYAPSAPIVLYVELLPSTAELERMPEADSLFLLDRPVRKLRLHGHEAGTAAKIKAALLYPPVSI